MKILENLEDGLGVGDLSTMVSDCNKAKKYAKAHLEDVLGTLLLSEGDLAVVNDDGVTVGTALIVRPANAL